MDMEKVIKGWECHMEADTLKCADCPYREGWRTCNFADTLFKDVYALLKEQEAVEPKSVSRHGANPQIQHFCGNCNAILYRHKQKYCINCGRPVKWE